MVTRLFSMSMFPATVTAPLDEDVAVIPWKASGRPSYDLLQPSR